MEDALLLKYPNSIRIIEESMPIILEALNEIEV